MLKFGHAPVKLTIVDIAENYRRKLHKILAMIGGPSANDKIKYLRIWNR